MNRTKENHFKLNYPEGSKVIWRDIDTHEVFIVEVMRVESNDESAVIMFKFEDGLIRTTSLPSEQIQQLN